MLKVELLSRCSICNQDFQENQLTPAPLVRESIAKIIQNANPDWGQGSQICKRDMSRFRTEYVRSLLEEESGELSRLDLEVLDSMQEHELLASNPVETFSRRESFGEHIADRVASFGGSWKFIGLFGIVLAIWVTANVISSQPFDPFPFILLNLFLSMIAAMQAPVIMMSQNRQQIKDRLHSESDYRVNLKAELEIRHLHEKVDHLLSSQWRRLTEIQQVQIELLNEMSAKG